MIEFNLDEYPDIDLNEFVEYVESTYFKFGAEYDYPLFMGKYSVDFWFHRDMENNQYTISGKITDYSKIPMDDALKEALENIDKNKKNKNFA